MKRLPSACVGLAAPPATPKTPRLAQRVTVESHCGPADANITLSTLLIISTRTVVHDLQRIWKGIVDCSVAFWH